jgi:hypothetical protein
MPRKTTTESVNRKNISVHTDFWSAVRLSNTARDGPHGHIPYFKNVQIRFT